jgi:hypothetical protein
MHCELTVPGLFAEASGVRHPALELLLARGRSSSGESMSLEAWLQQAFGIEDEPLPAGALTLAGAGGEPGEACWARADPVHLRLMRDRLIVAPPAAFRLSREEAEGLASALNRHFGEQLSLEVIEPERWCARLEPGFAFDADPPLEAAGRDADLVLRSAGEGGRRWGRLLNEIQMLLHAHPVNEAREARGEPPVNSLWLWGAGPAPRAAASPWQAVSADDPVALGLARLCGARPSPLPAGAHGLLERVAAEGRLLVVLDALRAPLALGEGALYRERLERLERDWFAPLLAALRSGRTGMVTVHVPDRLGASFETIRGDLRRFWRRPKALERYA